MQKTLWIDASAGISADRFVSALIGLGLPAGEITRVIKSSVEDLALLDAHTHLEFLPDGTLSHRLHLTPLERREPLPWEDAALVLDSALIQAGVTGPYADFARRTLTILRAAAPPPPSPTPTKSISLPIVGTAHTPYKHKAPYQPQPKNVGDGAFYIQVEPQYAAATQALETFSHIFVLSYLDRALDFELSVRPPWKDDGKRYGTFATRSPNRPSPIGLTRVRLHHVEGERIYTGPLDLFDGTPILDIKPFIKTLDGMADEKDTGNDGWLKGSDHLELHRLGIPHTHPGGAGTLSQPQILIAVLAGIAWGLQNLGVELSSMVCTSPANTGPEYALELSAQSILEQHEIPHQTGDVSGELVTPDGAAILAALSPKFVDAEDMPSQGKRTAYGLGEQVLDTAPSFGALRLFLF